MDVNTLKAMREASEKQFNDLQDELKRLQGEHRVLTKLIELKEQEDASDNAEQQQL